MNNLEATLRGVIDGARYMTLATAGGDGTPWASPVWFAHRRYREFVWVSRPEAKHSAHLDARPDLALVIFDSHAASGEAEAVYVEASAHRPEGERFGEALAAYSSRSNAQGMKRWTRSDVSGDAQFRLYCAVASRRYVLDESDMRVAVD